MGRLSHLCKCAVTVLWLFLANSASVWAQDVDVDALLAELANPAAQNWQQLERQIRTEWSRSGSAAIDFLYQRGEKALEAEDYTAALEHFTALTDHAPEFAEGWNGRATALFHKELYGPAIEDLSKVLALNPKHFEAITGLAVILQSVGRYKEALEAWRLVEAIHPHRPEMQKAIEALEKEVGGQSL